MSRNPSHIHKFKRHTYKSTGATVYFCALPDCNFKIGTQFALGKMCICWRCGNPFQMTAYSIRAAQPHCPACHNKKADRRVLPTRRELDPTVAQNLAESSIDRLQSQLSSLVPSESDDEEL